MNPRLLLVEDDPVSLAYLRAVLEALPATVDTAASASAALALPALHALWLIDANLPDGFGGDLLAQLRRRSGRTPALAHTADDSPDLHRELLAAGFIGVIVKPISAAALQAQVRAALAAHPVEAEASAAQLGPAPVWDEAQALAALNGNADSVSQLRGLFLSELAAQAQRIADAIAAGNAEAARTELHRLRASSGFVGASRVQQLATALSVDPADPDVLQAFLDACKQTRG